VDRKNAIYEILADGTILTIWVDASLQDDLGARSAEVPSHCTVNYSHRNHHQHGVRFKIFTGLDR
jgi:hypothetical protein